MSQEPLYSSDFYQNQRERSKLSARQVLPVVLEYLSPKSVVDVGCGTGSWLSVFEELGVPDIQGVDGDYVDRSLLFIDEAKFHPHDLKTPLNLGRQFDLVSSLEVAEHLPVDRAAQFVQTLTSLGPVVLFSAAVPGQGGTGHINEQWQDYWAALFAAQGYEAVDCVRPRIWDNPDVSWWYAQNTLLFVKSSDRAHYPALPSSGEMAALSVVHPRMLAKVSKSKKRGAFRTFYKKLLGKA